MARHSTWAGGERPSGGRRTRRLWKLATSGTLLALAALALIAALAAASSPPTIESINHKTGPGLGGQTVVIEGQNLSGATAVHFGSAEASFTVKSATQIRAVSPPGAGIVAITVTTPEGTSAHAPADEYIYEARVPTVSKLSASRGPAAGGVIVTISGANFLEVSSVQFGDWPAAEYTVDSPRQITAVSPAQSVALDNVRVTTPNGTSATRYCGPNGDKPQCSIRDHFKVVEPTVTGVSPSSGPHAFGTPITITGSGFELGTSGTTIKFGKAQSQATEVNCPSSSECTALAPGPNKKGASVVDVIVTVNGAGGVSAASPKNPPADQFTYSG
jgi:hypothetical protein